MSYLRKPKTKSQAYASRALQALNGPQVQSAGKPVLALSAASLHVLRQAMAGDVANVDMVPRILRDLDQSLDKELGQVTHDIENALKHGRPELVKMLLKRIAHLLK